MSAQPNNRASGGRTRRVVLDLDALDYATLIEWTCGGKYAPEQVVGDALEEWDKACRKAGNDSDQAVSYACGDCELSTYPMEYPFMVTDELWLAHGNRDGMLCVGCLEKRIGRTLCAKDFKPFMLHRDAMDRTDMSQRLQNRLAAEESVPLVDRERSLLSELKGVMREMAQKRLPEAKRWAALTRLIGRFDGRST